MTYTPAVSLSESTRAVLIPVKAFSDAKARLADALDPAERAALSESMATTVVRAAAPLAVWISAPTFYGSQDADSMAQ